MHFLNKNNIYFIIKEIKHEIKNISWPNKKEINQSTLIIMIILLLTSLVLWIIDSIFTYIISNIL